MIYVYICYKTCFTVYLLMWSPDSAYNQQEREFSQRQASVLHRCPTSLTDTLMFHREKEKYILENYEDTSTFPV